MKKYLLMLTVLSLNGLPGFAQSSSQTKTATIFNQFGEAYLNLWAREGVQYVATDDNVYAYSKKLSSGRGTLQLLLQGFGFTIPSGATIEQVTVTIHRFKKGKGSVRDYFAHLVVKENLRFTSYGTFWRYMNGNYAATEEIVTYSQNGSGDGGMNSDRPYVWTPEMINDPAFGLRLNTEDPVGSVVVYYDLVSITVQYSGGGVTRRSPVATEAGPLKAPMVYPNPFTARTNIQFAATQTGNAVVELYTVSGAKVKSLFSGSVVQGQVYNVAAGEPGMPKGVYIYRISNGQQKYAGRLVKLK